jgi:release factor glutamine methyltransferase
MSSLLAEIHRFNSQLAALYDPDEANGITTLVFEEVFDLSRLELKRDTGREVNPEERSRLDIILDRLLHLEPVQHILGFAWFMDDRFLVNGSTLIPRPETEELVSWIRDEYKTKSDLTVLDLGTGTGCIGISIQKRLKDTDLLAIDKSEAAIHTAQLNAGQILGNTAKNRFVVQDMLDARWWDQQGLFDIIVSNPPYVRELEKAEMVAQVLDFEPPQALFVPDTRPLLFYEGIAELAQTHLTRDGCLFFEINASFGANMQEMLALHGYGSEVRKDMQGKDRMVKAWRLGSES